MGTSKAVRLGSPHYAVGDTVDPRTLPVGAEWCYVNSDTVRRGKGVLLSLPTPKRPPCDACGEESCLSNMGAALCMFDARPARLCRNCWHDVASIDFDVVEKNVRARRAAQASPERPIVEPMSAASENPPRKSTGPSSLPTYDQIAGWLGAEWVMMCSGFDEPAPRSWPAMEQPSPWTHRVFVGDYQCSLLHAPSGQRVEVTAPREATIDWADLFDAIRRDWRAKYRSCVRWLDPDTKDSTGSEGGEAPDSLSREPSQATPSELIPPRCSSCKQPFWVGRPEAKSFGALALCGDCYWGETHEPADHLTNDLDTRIAEVAPEVVRVEDMPGAWATPCAEDVS